jgi:hypothetical protein
MQSDKSSVYAQRGGLCLAFPCLSLFGNNAKAIEHANLLTVGIINCKMTQRNTSRFNQRIIRNHFAIKFCSKDDLGMVALILCMMVVMENYMLPDLTCKLLHKYPMIASFICKVQLNASATDIKRNGTPKIFGVYL